MASLMPKAPLRIAINGFGRIGRNLMRSFLAREDLSGIGTSLEIVAINDVADADVLLHLLQYDSTHGRLSALGAEASIETSADDTYLCIKTSLQTRRIRLLSIASPSDLPWAALGVDVVLECTGLFRSYADASRHLQAGAQQVIVGAAPFDEVDASVVIGVNDALLTRDLPIISSVSCTTQALVPLLYVLDNAYGIDSAMMTEIHAVTADQSVLDQAHRDLRRARASHHNIIPTTSSSINATVRVLPQMAERLSGHSIRVPTINVAAIDVTVKFRQPPSLDDLRALLISESYGAMRGVMDYTDEPLVSSDFIGDTHSLIIDGQQLMQAGDLYKIYAWYDNEWGYANRLLEMCVKLAA